MAAVSACSETIHVSPQSPVNPPPVERSDAVPPVAPADAEPASGWDRFALWVWLMSVLTLLGLELVRKFLYYFGQG
jgi:hypothetical protein